MVSTTMIVIAINQQARRLSESRSNHFKIRTMFADMFFVSHTTSSNSCKSEKRLFFNKKNTHRLSEYEKSHQVF